VGSSVKIDVAQGRDRDSARRGEDSRVQRRRNLPDFDSPEETPDMPLGPDDTISNRDKGTVKSPSGAKARQAQRDSNKEIAGQPVMKTISRLSTSKANEPTSESGHSNIFGSSGVFPREEHVSLIESRRSRGRRHVKIPIWYWFGLAAAIVVALALVIKVLFAQNTESDTTSQRNTVSSDVVEVESYFGSERQRRC
jgi:hypothetical protein